MKIYLGIPFYGGACAEFVSSLVKTHTELKGAGHEVCLDLHCNCSVLPKARNEIVARFRASNFDKLLFLDTDMAWNVKDIFKLIDSEHDLCAIDYRKKDESGGYVGSLTGREKDGWAEATAIGAGLMCLTKRAIALMVANYPETKYNNEHGGEIFALFDFGVHDGKYWGEDCTFCRRWAMIDGDIAVLKDAATTHTGNKSYAGNRRTQ